MVHPAITNRDDPNWDESTELDAFAREAMDSGDYVTAIALFQQSVLLAPRYKRLFLLGECYVHENRLNEAVVAYAAATTLNRSGIAPAHLAELWFELGDLSRASEMIELAIARQPHYKRAQACQQKVKEALAERERQ